MVSSVLNQSDLHQFVERGFLKVNDCVPDAAQARDALWEDLKTRYDVSDDVRSWRGQYLNFPASAMKDLKLMPSALMGRAIDELLGGSHWTSDHQSKSCGTIFASLPYDRRSDRWSISGEWHWDMGENLNLPSYNGVLVCTLLTDAQHQSGGTLFVSGSHHSVAAHYHRTRGQFSDNYSAKRMQSFFRTEEWFMELDTGAVPKADRVASYMEKSSIVNGIQLQVHEMTGKVGDTYFIHPLLVHAGPPNGGNTPRMMHRSFARRINS